MHAWPATGDALNDTDPKSTKIPRDAAFATENPRSPAIGALQLGIERISHTLKNTYGARDIVRPNFVYRSRIEYLAGSTVWRFWGIPSGFESCQSHGAFSRGGWCGYSGCGFGGRVGGGGGREPLSDVPGAVVLVGHDARLFPRIHARHDGRWRISTGIARAASTVSGERASQNWCRLSL